jgi:hypothetical protein
MMKRAIVLTIVALFAVGAVAMGTTYSTTLYVGQNLVAPPGVPFNPDPAVVFQDNAGPPNPIPIMFALTRWDAAGQSYVPYNPFSPGDYGGVLLGEGAWLPVDPQVVWQYDGAPDGLPDTGGTMTDMWVSLPKAGLTLFGHPFNHVVTFANCFMTDGTQTLTMDQARTAGWTDALIFAWDGPGQSYINVGIDPWWYPDLEPYRGYWMTTFQDNLALIIPA